MYILKKISFFTAITIITNVVSFLMLPIMTKYLSPKDYGILSIFTALIQFISILSTMGLVNILMISVIDKDKAEFNIELGFFFKLTLINSVIISILIFLFILFFGSFFNLPNWLAVSSPIIAYGVSVFDVISGVTIFKRQQFEYAKLVLSKFFIEISATLFLIVGIGFNWLGRVGGLLISLLFVSILIHRYLKKEGHLNFKTQKSEAKQLIKNGAPLILMNASIIVMNLSDRFFIEKMVGLSDTGLYNVGAMIASIELIIASALISVFRPMIYTSLKMKTNNLKIQIFNILILIITLFGLFFISDFLFSFFIDEEYFSASVYVFPISLGFLFWGISNFYISYIIYYKKNIINAFIFSFAIVLNLVLNYIFISKYSTIGASYATTITYFLMALIIYFTFIYLKRNVKQNL